jgi:hypothetical protein
MGKAIRIATAGIAVLAMGLPLPIASQAAELGAAPARSAARQCPQVWACNPKGCGYMRICRPICPDRYSCAPLYGAYGPYGGEGYWGAYTYVGWGLRP